MYDMNMIQLVQIGETNEKNSVNSHVYNTI